MTLSPITTQSPTEEGGVGVVPSFVAPASGMGVIKIKLPETHSFLLFKKVVDNSIQIGYSVPLSGCGPAW